jgi:hypothetical protein
MRGKRRLIVSAASFAVVLGVGGVAAATSGHATHSGSTTGSTTEKLHKHVRRGKALGLQRALDETSTTVAGDTSTTIADETSTTIADETSTTLVTTSTTEVENEQGDANSHGESQEEAHENEQAELHEHEDEGTPTTVAGETTTTIADTSTTEVDHHGDNSGPDDGGEHGSLRG